MGILLRFWETKNLMRFRYRHTFFPYIFDREVKYADGLAQKICPAPLSDDLVQMLRGYAIQAHTLLGCRGVFRFDFIVDTSGDVFFLELNTIPGLTTKSLLPKAAEAAGYTFPALLDKIIVLEQEERI